MSLLAECSGPTQLLIVGVAHLDASIPDTALERGVALLRNWHPDLVAVECLPGHLVVEYEQRGGAFANFPVGGAVQARTGAQTVAGLKPWNVWRARSIARDANAMLTDRVVGWLLAREPYNALLLPWAEADLPPAAAAFLDQLEDSPSESVRVGVRLGRELGHSDLVHFDDHSGVELLDRLPGLLSATEDFYRALDGAGPTRPSRSDQDEWLRWVWASTPPARAWVESVESKTMALSDKGILRARHAQWRTRNLAMAARLREATALIPGGRLLAIVGQSHEPALRAALSVDQHDLVLTDIAELAG